MSLAVLDSPAPAPAPAAAGAEEPTAVPINRLTSIPFWIVHLLPLLAFFTGVDARALVIGAVFFWMRMFFITAGYHRYFAHRSYRMGRVAQAVMAFGGTTAAQKGPLWWASHHRDHHKYADTDRDPHSPLGGFFWSHMGWFLSDKYNDTDFDAIDDFARFPELRFINRHNWIGPWALGMVAFLIGGWSGLVVGFFASTVLLWHTTFLVNSAAHTFGRRRYATSDTSRNSLVIALLTSGEGWHNNHHHYPASARQGFFWWEIDVSWYVLRLLSAVGVVKDLRVPNEKARNVRRIRDGAPDTRMETPIAA